MKHFKDINNKVFAFEANGSQDHLIKPDMVEITVEDVKILTTPVLTTEQLAAEIRRKRAYLLSQTDWTQLSDKPQALKDQWAPYRQALCDIPQQEGFPLAVVWPTIPN